MTDEIRRTVVVRNALGLHARPATKLVVLVNGGRSRVRILDRTNDNEAMGHSVISVLSLGAPQYAELEVCVEGEDADTMMTAIADLFECGFGEEEP